VTSAGLRRPVGSSRWSPSTGRLTPIPPSAVVRLPDGQTFRAGVSPLPARRRPAATLSVLDVTEWYGATSGGIRTYLHEKARYIGARPDLRQVIVVPGAVDQIDDAPGVRMYRLRGPRIPGQPPYRFMLAMRSLMRIAQHERPHVIEIGSPFLVPWIMQRATRHLDIPLLCFHHTNVPQLLGGLGQSTRPWTPHVESGVWRYLRRLDRLFPLTIVTSRVAARELAAHGIERVVRVPLGVDLDTFTPVRCERRTETRAALGLPDAPLFGYAGRFAREKALDVVLDAWPAIEAQTGARLVLAGAGPMAERLRRHPAADRVIFLPFEQDRGRLADYLACLDVYLSPGPIETFGLAPLEALACGIPVLAPAAGGAGEHVEESGAGRVYVPGCAASLTEEAVALLQADLVGLGLRGRHYAEREHAWDTVFDRLMAVYRSVVTT